MTTEQLFDLTCASVVEVASPPLIADAMSRLDSDEAEVIEAVVDRFLQRLRRELTEVVMLGVSGE